MLKHILPLIPSHKLYTEAFCGGAAVFFAKRPAEAEVINDINMHLVNFYNTLQLDYEALKSKIDTTLHSRDMHAHAAHILAYPEFFDHIDRAWAVWALSKMSFASMLDGTFGYDFHGTMPKKLRNAKEDSPSILRPVLSQLPSSLGTPLRCSRLMTAQRPFTLLIPHTWGATAVITRESLAMPT